MYNDNPTLDIQIANKTIDESKQGEVFFQEKKLNE